MSFVVPAVLPTSRIDLEDKLELFGRIPSIDRVQIDVVDGRFAEPASWPYNEPRALADAVSRGDMLPNLDRITYEIDLMCFDAEAAADAWLALGATRLTFHAESNSNLAHLFSSLKKRYGTGSDFAPRLLSFGLALNVASDPVLIESFLSEISYVQFMGITRVGSQGQPFDPRVLSRVGTFHAQHPSIPVQVDGGVTGGNAKDLLARGVTNLVIGSGILRAKDPVAAVAALEALQSPYGV